MIYGTATKHLLADVVLQFEREEMHMIGWMCGVSLKDKWRIEKADWSWLDSVEAEVAEHEIDRGDKERNLMKKNPFLSKNGLQTGNNNKVR